MKRRSLSVLSALSPAQQHRLLDCVAFPPSSASFADQSCVASGAPGLRGTGLKGPTAAGGGGSQGTAARALRFDSIWKPLLCFIPAAQPGANDIKKMQIFNLTVDIC